MQPDKQAEVYRQVTEGNGHEHEETRGMTLRELVLELRNDQKQYPSRKEVYTVVGVLSAIVVAFATAGF